MDYDDLLTVTVTTTVPAPLKVLRERLDERLAECERREKKYKQWAETISGVWLLDEVERLRAAIEEAEARD